MKADIIYNPNSRLLTIYIDSVRYVWDSVKGLFDCFLSARGEEVISDNNRACLIITPEKCFLQVIGYGCVYPSDSIENKRAIARYMDWHMNGHFGDKAKPMPFAWLSIPTQAKYMVVNRLIKTDSQIEEERNRKPNVYDLAIEELHKLAEQFRGYSREFNKPIEAAKNLSIGEIKNLCEEFQVLPCVLKPNSKVEVTNVAPAAEPDATEFAIKHAVQAIKDSEPQEPISVSENPAKTPETQDKPSKDQLREALISKIPLKWNWEVTPHNVALADSPEPRLRFQVRPNGQKPGLFICEYLSISIGLGFILITDCALGVKEGQYICEEWYSESYGEKTDKAEIEPEKPETVKIPMEWVSAELITNQADEFYIGRKFRVKESPSIERICKFTERNDDKLTGLCECAVIYNIADCEIEIAAAIMEKDRRQKEAKLEKREHKSIEAPIGMQWKRATEFSTYPIEFFIGKPIKWLYDFEIMICNGVAKDETGKVMSLRSIDRSTGIAACEILLPVKSECCSKGCTQKIEENGCIIPKEKDSKPSKPDGIPSINISTRYQDGKLWVWFKESESYHWLPKGSLDTLYLDSSGLLAITANQGVYCCKLERLFINANHSEFKSDIVGSYSALLESELRGLGYTIEVCKDYLRVFRA